MAIHEVIEVTSQSEQSWEDAAQRAVADAGKIVDQILSPSGALCRHSGLGDARVLLDCGEDWLGRAGGPITDAPRPRAH